MSDSIFQEILFKRLSQIEALIRTTHQTKECGCYCHKSENCHEGYKPSPAPERCKDCDWPIHQDKSVKHLCPNAPAKAPDPVEEKIRKIEGMYFNGKVCDGESVFADELRELVELARCQCNNPAVEYCAVHKLESIKTPPKECDHRYKSVCPCNNLSDPVELLIKETVDKHHDDCSVGWSKEELEQRMRELVALAKRS